MRGLLVTLTSSIPLATDNRHLLLHFSPNGAFGPGASELLVLERGEGPYVYDTHGRPYLDGLSSLFCSQLGYSYGKEIGEAVQRQLERLPFSTIWSVAHGPALELAERLVDLAPDNIAGVFFTGGGSESVESAWKLARQYHVANGEPQRLKAIARKNCYHGVSMGALALTGVPRFKDVFGPPAIETRHVSNTNSFRSALSETDLTHSLLAEIEATIEEEGPETIAVMIAEPVQNAGGCLVPPAGYWQGLREITERHGILLVADETITAFGRLGEWFGSQRYDVMPDMITTAKGITAAYAPMGAVMVSEKVAAPFYSEGSTLLHGYTFAGHPVSATVALKSLEIFERDGVLENVRENEGYLQTALNGLRSLPIVGDVRGAGFFWAIELVKDQDNGRFDADERDRLVRDFLPRRLLEASLLARADDREDSVLHLAPPLICDRPVLEDLVDRVGQVLRDAGEFMDVSSSSPPARAADTAMR